MGAALRPPPVPTIVDGICLPARRGV